ncbi:lysoplasmalogenase [Tsukamurella soli]|uniref:YhhN-like protein n=1 Tax=Tsukamurella soli TaxID=644556 RepID=A0ABP8JTA0_9ACTN
MRASPTSKIAYAALAAADTVLAGSRAPAAHRARRFTKPLLMPTLAAAVVTDARSATSPLVGPVLAAEAASWCGDIALLGDDPVHFVVGATSFACAHASYIRGLLRRRGDVPSLPLAAVGVLWAVTVPAVAAGAARERCWLAPVVAGYSATLAGTAAAATQLDPALPVRARRAALVGAGLFLLSDALLGARRFLLRDAPPWIESAVMATYAAAQFLLADVALKAAG